jgi:hypothetical protein
MELWVAPNQQGLSWSLQRPWDPLLQIKTTLHFSQADSQLLPAARRRAGTSTNEYDMNASRNGDRAV